ncbi:MAG: MoxR family ATPase, partial [Dehalococcoidia bacterium]|nr:MoxR family ATPase [Dehalococcoidia bacterium]
MRPRDVKALLKEAIKNPLGTPPIHLWGPPGGGKSAMPKQVAEEEKVGFVDMRLAQRDPTDLRGIPAVIDGKARWLSPPELPTEGKGFLFLDELTSCPPLTQASAYQLTLDRKIGEYSLPEGWYIVAAGNRLQDRAVVYRMSTALANRFVHINFEVNLDDWLEWAMREKINPNIIGFINWRGGDLLAPDFNPESDEKAFPSPRTWEFASKLLGGISNTRVLHESLEGTIGKGATAEFMAFLKVQTELPDLDTIFAGNNYIPPENRMDLRYALVSALATRATPKQFDRMVKYSDLLPAEFGVLLVQTLAHRDA